MLPAGHLQQSAEVGLSKSHVGIDYQPIRELTEVVEERMVELRCTRPPQDHRNIGNQQGRDQARQVASRFPCAWRITRSVVTR